MTDLTGEAAGVPYIVDPPDDGRPDAPVVVAWHMLDAPRTEAAFRAALPLSGLDAWRVYLGLPLSGSRLPDGGLEEAFTMAARDLLRLGLDPVVRGAADEFGPAFAALCERFGFGAGPLGLLGGSAGAAVALETLARDQHDVTTAVLVNPAVRLRAVVDGALASTGRTYPWDAETDAVAARMDYLARVRDLGTMPLRVIVGADDDPDAILEPAMAFVGQWLGPADMVTVDGLGHPLAPEPGLEPAPQSSAVAEVDGHATAWLRQMLR